MTPKVQIGSAYFPHSFVRRTDTTFMALRPAMSGDAERLQRALLKQRAPFFERLWSLVRIF